MQTFSTSWRVVAETDIGPIRSPMIGVIARYSHLTATTAVQPIAAVGHAVDPSFDRRTKQTLTVGSSSAPQPPGSSPERWT